MCAAVTVAHCKTDAYAKCSNINYEFGLQYGCVFRDFYVDRPDFAVYTVAAEHLPGKTQADVLAIHIENQYTKYLPTHVESVYWNMITYRAENSQLEILGNFNLFKKLRYLILDRNLVREVPKDIFSETVDMEWISMNDNRIETLDKDLFRTMPMLRVVSFSGNRLRKLSGELFTNNMNLEFIYFAGNGMASIGSDLLKGSTKLRVIDFDANICINDAFYNDPSAVDNVSRQFFTFCSGQCDNAIEGQQRVSAMNDKNQEMRQQNEIFANEKRNFCRQQMMRTQNRRKQSSSSSLPSSSSSSE